jgi:hypothetical protein
MIHRRIAWLAVAVLVGCGTSHVNEVSQSQPVAPAAAERTTVDVTTRPVALISPSPDSAPNPTDSSPRDTLPWLASDGLQGRGLGTTGIERAADFIASEFAADGLSPCPGLNGFFQPVPYAASIAPDAISSLKIGNHPLTLGENFSPLKFSTEGAFSGAAAFVGYGITDPKTGYDDYAGVDAKGKIVIAMRFEPVDAEGHSRLYPKTNANQWSDNALFAAKVKNAEARGAASLLLVDPPGSDADELMQFWTPGAFDTKIPVLQITRATADQILAAGQQGSLKSLKTLIDSTFKPASVVLAGTTVSGDVKIKRLTGNLRNVIGCLAGAGPHADEFVVVGAHYDHLGLGQMGHMFGHVGSIYHGADDNASGTSVILALAARFAKAPPPDRSILFMCYTGEEEGLIGSEYFVNHSPLPLEKIVAMLNLDMVGRLKDQTLYMGGAGTDVDFDAILKTAISGSPLRLKSIGRGGMGPSDHMSFAQKRIPVLFLFSGLHVDYHRPTDTADRINYAGIDEVAKFCARIVTGLTKMPHGAYVADADKDSMHLFGSPNFAGGPARRVILGVVPDYGSADSRVGVLIAGTTPGTPAETAGLKNGDLLVQFNDQKLENLMDLTQALGAAKPGDKVKLRVLRGSQTLVLDITLAERKS